MSPNIQPLVATIYNPHTQSKEALIAGFIARRQKFERLFRDVRDAPMIKPEQHYLIQGIRGMGKTTFLLRIAYEIENTPNLRSRLIPIVFNEEEYGIGSLADVWERTARYMEEADNSFDGLYDSITAQYGQDDYEQRALDRIIVALNQQNKKILLLIDNIGDLLKKLTNQEEKRLREILLTTPELRLIGATSVVIEQAHDYSKPFYEFFKVIHLEGLSREETIDLFLKLGETYHADAIQQIIAQQPGRIEAIRRLTGGVIRTMVLLFEILLENNPGSVFRDLNLLLDRVTPLYKHRMDDLPAQQQKIVSALATAWDAASAKELAQVVRLESKVVSAQLKQLINNGVVERVETNTKNHLYRLEERFFNIWYLMRFGRKTDQRVLWLVRFFEEMFGNDTTWIQERIDGHLRAIELGTMDPEAALYLTTALAGVVKDEEIEDLLKRKTRVFLTESGRSEWAEEVGNSKYDLIDELIYSGKFHESIFELEKFKNRNQQVLLDLASCYALTNQKNQAGNLIIEILMLQARNDKELEPLEHMEIKAEKSRSMLSLSVVIGLILILYIVYVANKPKLEKKNFLSSNKERDFKAELALWNFFLMRKNRKSVSLQLIAQNHNSPEVTTEDLIRSSIAKNIIYLWNNKFEDSNDILNLDFSTYWNFYPHQKGVVNQDVVGAMLKLLLAKKQYHTAYNYFQQEEWQLKDRFKPLYYATMYFLRDEYPTEYLRMGPELKETVDDILAEVAQMAIDYA